MYPLLPFPGYSWSMNHHMGVTTEGNLHALVWAANTFGRNNDPDYDINNYLIANNILTRNVRKDSRQPDTWRDYQQIPSELGLLFSTKIQKPITLTPIGLAFIEKTITYDELMTLQALRYQYPNGHKSTISPTLRSKLSGTQFQSVRTLTELQARTGVRIRPAVLIWRVLRELQDRGENNVLNISEVQKYLLPCRTHSDTKNATEEIVKSRQTISEIPFFRASRDLQEWYRFLVKTPLFTRLRAGVITISDFAMSFAADIDEICSRLEEPDSFWMPDSIAELSNISWYAEYGSIDLSIDLISNREDILITEIADLDVNREGTGGKLQKINLRPFDPVNLLSEDQDSADENDAWINYETALGNAQYILHDHMVKIIAEVCDRNGGQVFDDPQSLDLLIGFQSYEFLVEVKSVTSRNFVRRLRLALGQLLHYDYLRSLDSSVPRRKVVAFAARIPSGSWSVPFLNSFLDIDLLTLGVKGLEVNSTFDLSKRLFVDRSSPASLFDLF